MNSVHAKVPRGLPRSATEEAHCEHATVLLWMAEAGVSKHVRKMVISHVSEETFCRIYAHDAWCFLENLKLLTRTRVRFSAAALERLCAEVRIFWRMLPLPILRYAITTIDACMKNIDEDERENGLSDLFRKLSEVQYWLDAGPVPFVLSHQQASWAWVSKAAAAWVESEHGESSMKASNPYSWTSVLAEADLCLYVARALVDSETFCRKAKEYGNCIFGNTRYARNGIANRARYFEFLLKPDLLPAAIVELLREGDNWIVGQVAGPGNTKDLFAERQATSLARKYSEIYQQANNSGLLCSDE